MNSSYLLKSQLESPKYPFLYAQRNFSVPRIGLDRKLEVHNGCINSLSWSDINCNLLLSGSDDQHLSITDAFTGEKKVSVHTGHRANIFSAKFLPGSNDERLISSSANGSIYLTDLNQSSLVNNQQLFSCHGNKTCYEVRTFLHDPSIFISCGQDGCCKWVDLRQTSKCEKQFCQEHSLIKLSTGISAIAINPYVPYHLVCAGLDGIVRFYDRRMLSVGAYDSVETISILTDQSTKGLFASFGITPSEPNSPTNTCNIPGNTVISNKRVTSLQYNNWGSQLLVSYQSDNIYLLDWRDLSMDNKNDTNNVTDATSSKKDDQAESPTSGSPTERKFRIQTDWSDTGPDSQPIETSETNDPRSFLMSRLNEWFNNLYQSHSGANSQSNTSTTSPTSQTSTINSIESQQPTTSSSEEMTEADDQRLTNISSTDMNTENNSQEDLKPQTETERRPKPNLSPITSHLMCSRIRSRQAMKLENNILKKQPSPKVNMIYTGHRNARTMIKECNFWGDEHVISGSDCGHIFFWNKNTGKIVNVIEADKRVVNCVQENPLFPALASSGIDYDVKIWQPILKNSEVEQNINSKINLITRRNKLMLDENRKTIFIPVQFMVPALRLFGANMRSNSTVDSEEST